MTRPDAPLDPPLRLLRLPSGPVAYTDSRPDGPGLPLLAVHGLPGSVRDWRWLDAALAGLPDAPRLVRVDQAGFGGTPLTTWPEPSNEERAAMLVAFAEALGLERFVPVGHSMGAAVTTAIAEQAADRVPAVALLAPSGARKNRGMREARLGIVGPLVAATWLRPVTLPLLRKGFTAAGFPRSTADEALVHTVTCSVAADFAAHGARMSRLDRPTLVAWAEDDHLVEPAIFHEIESLVPAGPRLRVQTGGHNLQKTWANELARLIAELLAAA